MGQEDVQFGIAITTTADTAALNKFTKGLQDVKGQATAMGDVTTDATADASKGLRDMGGDLKGVSLGFRSASLLGRSLGSVMAGDVTGGIQAASFAVKGLNTAIRANPLGLLAAAIALALPFITKLATATEDVEDGAKGAGKEVKGMADEAKPAKDIIDGLGRKIGEAGDELDEFTKAEGKNKQALKALHDDFKSAAEEANKLAEAEKAVIAAELALNISRVKKDEAEGRITPEQSEQRQRILGGKAKGDELDAADRAARTAARKAGELAGQAQLQVERDKKALDEARKAQGAALRSARDAGLDVASPDDLAKARETAGKNLDAARRYVDPSGEGSEALVKGVEKQIAALDALEKATKELARREGELAGTMETPGSEKRYQEAKEQLAKANQEAAAKLRLNDLARKTSTTDQAAGAAKADEAATIKAGQEARDDDKKDLERKKAKAEVAEANVKQALDAAAPGTAYSEGLIKRLAQIQQYIITAEGLIKAVDRAPSAEDQAAQTLKIRGVGLEAGKQIVSGREKAAAEARKAAENPGAKSASIEGPARDIVGSAEKHGKAVELFGAAARQMAGNNDKLADVVSTLAGQVQGIYGKIAALQSQVSVMDTQAKNRRSRS